MCSIKTRNSEDQCYDFSSVDADKLAGLNEVDSLKILRLLYASNKIWILEHFPVLFKNLTSSYIQENNDKHSGVAALHGRRLEEVRLICGTILAMLVLQQVVAIYFPFVYQGDN